MTVADSQQAPLACPVCSRPLRRDQRAWACDARHSFDISRDGYVNLLPPQHRLRNVTGDLPEMLRARRRIHDAGLFAPLLDGLRDAVAEELATRDQAAPPVLLEVGCGDGYYVGSIGESLRLDRFATVMGTDLSKPATRLAAGRYKDALFFVSDINRRLYLMDGSVDVLLDVFSPRNPDEFARVLAPTGAAIVVIPDVGHFASVRSSLGLLGMQADKEQLVIERMSTRFKLCERRAFDYGLSLTAEQVGDYVEMGPNHWHHKLRDRSPVGLSTEASFVVLVFRHVAW